MRINKNGVGIVPLAATAIVLCLLGYSIWATPPDSTPPDSTALDSTPPDSTTRSFSSETNDRSADSTVPSVVATYHDNSDLASWANFESRMLSFGATHGDWLIANQDNADWGPSLNRGYYDFGFIAYTIAEYTGADVDLWRSRGDAWLRVYDNYVTNVASGAPAGWYKFTGGLRKKHHLTGDVPSRTLVSQIALHGAYNPDATPIDRTADAAFSREVAYAVMNYIDDEKLGAPHRAKMEDFISQIYAPKTGHFAQWFDSPPYVPKDGQSYFSPFMWGLSSLAGIQYVNDIGPDARILPAIRAAADWVRPNCWSDKEKQHLYRTNDPLWGNAPDLEMFVAPVYWWLYKMTGDTKYKAWGDASFNAAFATRGGAYLTGGKQFTESFRWVFDGLLYRAQGDALHLAR
jgi:hypothetical protein